MSKPETSFAKNAGVQKAGPRRIMRKLRIDEISGVDVPAQEGATAPIMKRRDGAPDNSQNQVLKRAALTTEVDGHVHVIYLDYGNGELNTGETSWSNGHSHPWIRKADGSIEIGAASGHAHEVATVGKQADQVNQGDPEMTPEQIAALQAQLAKAEAIAALPADQRAHYDSLAEAERPAFLAKSADDRAALVKMAGDLAKAENAVIYTAKDGTVYTKKSDPALVSMAKRLDALNEDLAKSNEVAKNAEYVKRAKEIENLPGDEATHIEMLKAIDAIGDKDKREAALKALKAQSVEFGKAFGEAGDSFETPEARDANDQLETLAKNYVKAHPEVSDEAAMAAVLETREGRDLYAQTVQQ